MHVQLQHSAYSPIKSGQERRIHALVQELRRRGHRVTVVVSREGLEGTPDDTDAGLSFWVHPDLVQTGWRSVMDPVVYPRRLQRFLRDRYAKERPDVVLSFNIFYVMATKLACPDLPVGYLTGGAIRDWYAWLYGHRRGLSKLAFACKARMANAVEGRALTHAKTVFVEVAAVAERLREHNPAAVARYLLWPTPVDQARFRPRPEARAAIRSQLGIGEHEVMILGVGRLQWNKNFNLMVRALGAARQRNFRLVIAGEGPDREALQRLAASLGIGERLQLLGARADIEQLYAATDIFAHAALTEPYGNVVQEAAATGAACLVSPGENIGFSQFLSDGVNALLADPADERAWTEKFEALLASRELREQLATAALGLIRSRPNWAELTDVLLRAM